MPSAMAMARFCQGWKPGTAPDCTGDYLQVSHQRKQGKHQQGCRQWLIKSWTLDFHLGYWQALAPNPKSGVPSLLPTREAQPRAIPWVWLRPAWLEDRKDWGGAQRRLGWKSLALKAESASPLLPKPSSSSWKPREHLPVRAPLPAAALDLLLFQAMDFLMQPGWSTQGKVLPSQWNLFFLFLLLPTLAHGQESKREITKKTQIKTTQAPGQLSWFSFL